MTLDTLRPIYSAVEISNIAPTTEEVGKITKHFERITFDALVRAGASEDVAKQAIANRCPFEGTYSSRDANNVYTLRLDAKNIDELINSLHIECTDQRPIPPKQQLKIAKAMYVVGERNFGFDTKGDESIELLILYLNYFILKKSIKTIVQSRQKDAPRQKQKEVAQVRTSVDSSYWRRRIKELQEGGKWQMPFGYPYSEDVWRKADAIKRFE